MILGNIAGYFVQLVDSDFININIITKTIKGLCSLVTGSNIKRRILFYVHLKIMCEEYCTYVYRALIDIYLEVISGNTANESYWEVIPESFGNTVQITRHRQRFSVEVDHI